MTASEAEVTKQNLLKTLQEKSGVLTKQKSGLESQLQKTAKKEQIALQDRYAKHLGQQSDEWSNSVDDISKKHGDVEINASSVADDIESKLVEKRNLLLEQGESGETSGGTNATEKALLSIANKLRTKGAISLKEALGEASQLSKRAKTGTGYSSDDHLINEVKDIILSKAEKATGNSGEISALRKGWAKFAQERQYSMEKFGFFSKRGPEFEKRGREMVQKIASGSHGDIEEQTLAANMKKRVGPIGTESSKVASQIKGLDDELGRISQEVDALSKNPIKSASKSTEYMKQAKDRITKSIEKEISDLRMNIEHESALIENSARTRVAESSGKTEKAINNLRELKRRLDTRQKQLIKAAAITTVGGLVLFRKQIGGLASTAAKIIA